MRRTILAAAALLLCAPALPAQQGAPTPELRPFVGAVFNSGDQARHFTDAAIFGLQAAVEVLPTMHLLGTFGWVPGQTKYDATNNHVNVFSYDAGLELGIVRAMEPEWQVKPFLGAGVGERTYSYKASELRSRSCTAAYGAAGTELQMHRIAFRFEGRDDVFCYRAPFANAPSRTRNDIRMSVGLAYHF